MEKTLSSWAKEKGYRIAWGQAAVIVQADKELSERKKAGMFDEQFFQSALDWFKYPEAISFPEAKSVIVLAISRPAHEVIFHYQQRRLAAILPPTYLGYRPFFATIRQELLDFLPKGSHQIEILKAPLKTVAVLLGLAKYGRNNITYVAGLGSYFQLVGLLTDIELKAKNDGQRAELEQLADCRDCEICLRACPTGAIGRDRFLLRAEKCLTYHSEKAGFLPTSFVRQKFPSLYGCLQCQLPCPQNKIPLPVEPAGIEFSADETERILRGEEHLADGIGQSISAKIDTLALSDSPALLRRNLRAIIAARFGSV
jgi:epoxyqueuosine reductase